MKRDQSPAGPSREARRFEEYWRVVWHRKWVIALTVVAALAAVVVGNWLSPRIFESSSTLYIKDQVPSVLGGSLATTGISDLPLEDINTQMEILRSRSLLVDVISTLGLEDVLVARPGLPADERLQLTIDSLRRQLSVTSISGTRLVRVSVRSPDPVLATRIVNAICQSFIQRNVGSRRSEANAVLAFVTDQVNEVSARLDTAEADLLAYRQSHRIADLSEEAKLRLDRLSDLDTRYQQARLDRQILATRIAAAQQLIAASPSGNAALQQEIADYRYQDSILAAQEKAYEGLIGSGEADLNALSAQDIGLARLERTRRINDDLYSELVKSKNEAQIEAISQLGNIDVIDPAVTPLRPVSPRKEENLIIGFLLSLVLGICFALLLDHFDTTVRSEEEIKDLMEIPLLGFIPRFHQNGYAVLARASASPVRRLPVFTRDEPRSPISEAFRLLRTNLFFIELDKGLKTIAVTSAIPGEGKTMVAVNLAAALAAQEERVLLIDADFRAPAVHRALLLPQVPGFTNILVNRLSFRDVLHEVEGVENLAAITAGPTPPNPAEITGSARMRELIAELRSSFDRIIFDGPPVLGATDAVVLASHVDGALVVLRKGRIDRRAVRRMTEILHHTRVTVLGGVVNGIERADAGYGYGYGYYYPRKEPPQ